MSDLYPSSVAEDGREILSVSQLNRNIKTLIEGSIGTVWLQGEISNLARPASGHVYFSLKDDRSQVRCAFFRGAQQGLEFVPENGMQVLVRARASLYEARGEYQLIVDNMEPAGEGALRQALEKLKAGLLAEGLFDTAAKTPLPPLPKRIGVITSPTGAVLHDILTTLRRRFPAIPVVVYAVPVQGDPAAGEIAAMIRLADKRAECDVLVLARGGGSLEDLWPFNAEIVARAIFHCRIPLVCGVGHETDFTIADLVADVRAPTPTAAAELLSPDQYQLAATIDSARQRLARLIHDRLNHARQDLDWLSTRLIHPRKRIRRLRERLELLIRRMAFTQQGRLHQQRAILVALQARVVATAIPERIHSTMRETGYIGRRLRAAWSQRLRQERQQLNGLGGRLQALSPLATLARGFAIVSDPATGAVVEDARRVKKGDRVAARLARGRLECVVEVVHENK